MNGKINTYTELSGIVLLTFEENGKVFLCDKTSKYTTSADCVVACRNGKDGLRVKLIDRIDKEPETAFFGSDIIADIDAGIEDYGQV